MLLFLLSYFLCLDDCTKWDPILHPYESCDAGTERNHWDVCIDEESFSWPCSPTQINHHEQLGLIFNHSKCKNEIGNLELWYTFPYLDVFSTFIHYFACQQKNNGNTCISYSSNPNWLFPFASILMSGYDECVDEVIRKWMMDKKTQLYTWRCGYSIYIYV